MEKGSRETRKDIFSLFCQKSKLIGKRYALICYVGLAFQMQEFFAHRKYGKRGRSDVYSKSPLFIR